MYILDYLSERAAYGVSYYKKIRPVRIQESRCTFDGFTPRLLIVRVKLRSEQQAYTRVVKSTWNQALSRSRRQSYSGKPHWNKLHDVVLQPSRTICESPYLFTSYEKFFETLLSTLTTPIAQSAEQWTLGLKVMGSIPTGDMKHSVQVYVYNTILCNFYIFLAFICN